MYRYWKLYYLLYKVDPVPLDSSVKFVRGSHRWGQWFHPRKFATEANYPLEAGAGAGRAEGGDKVFADVPVAEIESGQHEVSRAGRGHWTVHRPLCSCWAGPPRPGTAWCSTARRCTAPRATPPPARRGACSPPGACWLS